MVPRLATKSQQLGPYTLVERLAQGGMAAVYKAKLLGPEGFEKTVVVKKLLPALAAHEELVELFCAEARLSAQLNHPNIVQVIDFGVSDGTPYLVMEYLEGWTLAQLRDRLAGARKGRLPVGAAAKVARDVCLALGYAHNFTDREGTRRQIIHRDVSPSNVMLCRDGTVKLLDFGIARVANPSGTDITNTFRGKYAYMAPEQVKRQPLDRRVDVFAAGIVLHEMLTGKRLFASVSELETLERVAKAQVTAPSGENPEVPRALDLIVKKALSKEANARYTSGHAMAEALDTLDTAIFSRRKLAQMLKQIYPECWTVVCEVCGKQVVPGRECGECGTAAPLDESSASDADVQPLPPPPAGPPKKPFAPPRLFVVPKLPERAPEDDSIKMGLPNRTSPGHKKVPTRELTPFDTEPPTIRQDPPKPEPKPAVVLPMRAEWGTGPATTVDPLPPPNLRTDGKGTNAALALLLVGIVGIGGALLWKGPTMQPAPPAPQRVEIGAPIVLTKPATAKISAPITAPKPPIVAPKPIPAPVIAAPKPIPAPVVAAKPAPKPIPAPKVAHRRVHKAKAVASSSTVRDGRIVDPFAGGE